MTDILEQLELRQVSTLVNLPKDKQQWPVTVTVQELDALILVARAAESYCQPANLPNTKLQRLAYLEEALQQLRAVGTGAEHKLSGKDRI